jgi:hypothetical protein
MIITVIGQPPTVTSPGTFPQVISMPTIVEGPPQAFREALQDVPHAIQIPYPEDPLARSLVPPLADAYYVCYTPMPVYFCHITGGYCIETPDGVHWVKTLMEVWDIAKAL